MKICSQILQIDSNDIMTEIAKSCSDGRDVIFTPKGMSMYPFIVGSRDSVVLRKEYIIRKGDIVAARIPGKGCVLHRIYSLSGNRLTLMGDSNLCATEVCTRKDVLATVSAIVRNGKRINCHSTSERSAVKLWMCLQPIRRYLLWILRKLRFRL